MPRLLHTAVRMISAVALFCGGAGRASGVDSQQAMHRADIMDRISSAEMPPESADQRKADDTARVVEWISTQFNEAEAVGHWRTEAAVRDGSGDNPGIDASGELPDGRKSLAQIAAQARTDGYKRATLIENTVMSDFFRKG